VVEWDQSSHASLGSVQAERVENLRAPGLVGVPNVRRVYVIQRFPKLWVGNISGAGFTAVLRSRVSRVRVRCWILLHRDIP
jgi:hypothetical protein